MIFVFEKIHFGFILSVIDLARCRSLFEEVDMCRLYVVMNVNCHVGFVMLSTECRRVFNYETSHRFFCQCLWT